MHSGDPTSTLSPSQLLCFADESESWCQRKTGDASNTAVLIINLICSQSVNKLQQDFQQSPRSIQYLTLLSSRGVLCLCVFVEVRNAALALHRAQNCSGRM